MHLLEDLLALALHLHAHGASEFLEVVLGLLIMYAEGGHVYDHHHVEVAAHDGLADVEDVDVVLGQVGAYTGNDTLCVFADDGNDCLVSFFLYPCFYTLRTL